MTTPITTPAEALEAAAKIAEDTIVGGRMWTEEQAQAAEHAGYIADAIRALASRIAPPAPAAGDAELVRRIDALAESRDPGSYMGCLGWINEARGLLRNLRARLAQPPASRHEALRDRIRESIVCKDGYACADCVNVLRDCLAALEETK